MKLITVTLVDFDDLAKRSDEEILSRFVFAYRSSKKRILPKSVVGMSKRVRREGGLLSVDLVDSEGKTVAELRFAPIPPFR